MLQYKANLEVLNHRYTDIERQLLKAFVRSWQRARQFYPGMCIGDIGKIAGAGTLRVYADMWWTVTNLLDDGIIEFREEENMTLRLQEQERNARVVLLTEKGREFLAHWIAAQPI